MTKSLQRIGKDKDKRKSSWPDIKYYCSRPQVLRKHTESLSQFSRYLSQNSYWPYP